MLIFGPHFRAHRRWAAAFAAGTAAAAAAFVWAGWGAARPPGGGSLLGLCFGGLAAGVFVFECLLVPRKWVRWRVGPPVRAWMRAHLWLGLLAVPLVVFHTGLRVGGGLPLALTATFAAVVASGLWAVWVQHRLPRRTTAEVPEETIARQIGPVMRSHAEELARLLDDVCGLPDRGGELAAAAVGYRTAAARTEGRVRGKTDGFRPPAAEVPGAEPVRRLFLDHARAYLLDGRGARSLLADAAAAAGEFRRVRAAVPAAAHPAVEAVERACDRRRQLDHQADLDDRLQRWRWVHVPLSVLLLALTAAHAWTALRYW
jgi:hypothetical protein